MSQPQVILEFITEDTGLSAIREQIRIILEEVVGIGIVHEYERYHKDWKKFLTHFAPENPPGVQEKINGWTITREKTPEKLFAQGDIRTRVHCFVIRGYYSLNDEDASEKTFQDLIESIEDTFYENDTLNGSCNTLCPSGMSIAGPQVDVVEPRLFGTVLCHYCEIRLYPEEYKGVS